MNEVTITVLGDICPTADYQDFFDKHPEALFTDIGELAQGADFAICNLECPATNQAEPIVKTGPNLKSKPAIFETLKAAGIKAVSLANNHILDYGEAGVQDTVRLAEEQGIMMFGGGRNSAEAAKPLKVDINGVKVSFLSYAEHEFNLATEKTPGANWFDPYKSLNEISRQKAESDYVIVLYHGGIEHYKFPSPMLQKKCRAMVEAGADAVFCQHSHCIGTTEAWQGKPIVYGQGNTVFGYRPRSAAWNEGFAFTLVLTEGTVRLESRLLHASADGIRFAPREAEQARQEQFEQDSACLSDPEIIRSRWLDFCKAGEALVLPNLYGKSRVFNKLNRMLNNRLINLLMNRKNFLVTLAYIRCEAHREVLTTILEHKANEK